MNNKDIEIIRELLVQLLPGVWSEDGIPMYPGQDEYATIVLKGAPPITNATVHYSLSGVVASTWIEETILEKYFIPYSSIVFIRLEAPTL